MRWKTFVVIAVGLTLLTGCVSKHKYQSVVSQLEESQRTSTQTGGDLEALKQQAAAEKEAFTLEEARLATEMLAARQNEEQTQSELASAKYHLGNEQEQRKQAEKALNELSKDYEQLEQTVSHLRTERDDLANNINGLQAQLDTTNETLSDAEARIAGLEAGDVTLRQERDQLENHSNDLQRQLDTSQQELASYRKASEDAAVRLSGIQQEKDHALAALAAEQAKFNALQDEKQQLLSDTNTAQDEIARLQKRAEEREALSARVSELDQQLKEREQEIVSLRQAVGDRETLSAKLASKEEELDALGQEATRVTQERDRLTANTLSMTAALEQSKEEAGFLHAQVQELEKELKAEQLAKDNLVKERAAREGNIQLLTQSKEDLSRSLKERESERAAKEAEVRRLTETHEKLKRSLESEIEKGDVRIKQVRDRLRINMIDQILFDSGKAKISTAGLEVLYRVSEVLKSVTDKQIRIEGHTDTVPIGPKIVSRFPTNWELSTARATSVVRYLIDKGGLEKTHLAATGYAYNRPVASNKTPDGREQNRRIEVVLYPKDLSEIASF